MLSDGGKENGPTEEWALSDSEYRGPESPTRTSHIILRNTGGVTGVLWLFARIN